MLHKEEFKIFKQNEKMEAKQRTKITKETQ